MNEAIILFEYGLYGAFIIFTWVVMAALLSFMFWMAVDAANNDRFWWLLFIFAFPIVGFWVYYITFKREGVIPPHTDHYGRRKSAK